jgi:mannosyl-3-phosphoglycerate phosphatase
LKLVVFTDMDGTLIDHHTYSYEAARPALESLQRLGVPLVVCTSKTRAEIQNFREKLGVSDPFISENGGAIFIPKGYFEVPFTSDQETENYLVVELGTSYQVLRGVLKDVEKKIGCQIRGFGDMTAQEVSEDSGLDLKSAELSKMREYDEPFKIEGDEEQVRAVLEEIQSRGLNYTRGGRYYHIMGDNDKGRAVATLAEIFRREFKEITTVGLGDSLNDLPMLESVDLPVLVQKPDGSYESMDIEVKRAGGVGPVGWNRAVMEILNNR